jgi:hypothetical protein
MQIRRLLDGYMVHMKRIVVMSMLDKDKAKEFYVHRSNQEKMKAKQQLKEKIDQTSSNIEYVICIFEIESLSLY